ncbi:transposase family protein [uncultured Microscilla sp.]|uniref:helix-turn-helix domain-containing protein n=1 Tax=uncultured Microscilla sp. TaxID=432653 RepID=UPI002619A422|nr:transposase family protein [uncultured Microscilla sp.]
MKASKYAVLSKLSNNKFRRYTGLRRDNFELIKLIIEKYEQDHKIKSGRPSTLCVEDQILMLLEYYRENRTFFHLGISYGLHESNAQRTVVKIEEILLKSGYFRLEGKKILLTDQHVQAILIDVTETLAQRPKKKGATNEQ